MGPPSAPDVLQFSYEQSGSICKSEMRWIVIQMDYKRDQFYINNILWRQTRKYYRSHFKRK